MAFERYCFTDFIDESGATSGGNDDRPESLTWIRLSAVEYAASSSMLIDDAAVSLVRDAERLSAQGLDVDPEADIASEEASALLVSLAARRCCVSFCFPLSFCMSSVRQRRIHHFPHK